MLRLLSRRVPLTLRRNFSKYMEDNYGKNVHRLANRPEVEVSAFEIFTATLGSIVLLGDMVRDQRVHRRMFDENGQPDEVWNQRLWIRPGGYNMRSIRQEIY